MGSMASGPTTSTVTALGSTVARCAVGSRPVISTGTSWNWRLLRTGEIVTVTRMSWFSGTSVTPSGRSSWTSLVNVSISSLISIGTVRTSPPIALIALRLPVTPTVSGCATYPSNRYPSGGSPTTSGSTRIWITSSRA